MNENDKMDLLLVHDKHIEVMSQSIEHLAEAVGNTNKKMDNIIDVMSSQNVILEKVNNMDTNLKESFNRVHDKIRVIENAQNADGCTTLRVQSEHITNNDREIKALKDLQKNAVPQWLIKVLLGVLIVNAVSFGTYVVSSIQGIKVNNGSRFSEISAMKDSVKSRLDSHDNFIRDNFTYSPNGGN